MMKIDYLVYLYGKIRDLVFLVEKEVEVIRGQKLGGFEDLVQSGMYCVLTS